MRRRYRRVYEDFSKREALVVWSATGTFTVLFFCVFYFGVRA